MNVRRLLVVTAAAVGLLVPTATPAAADPAGPTHYDSSITAVVALDGGEVPIDVEVLGGDAFLVVTAPPGTTVDVPGYEGEPYLRIGADGRVEVNTRSPARWLNDARYGERDTQIPPEADASAPPTWETVALDGVYAWHDHRVHFMSPVVPPQVDRAAGTPQPVFDWVVPLTVDGRDVEVQGSLVWVPGPAPVVPLGLLSLAIVAAVLAVLRRGALLAPSLLGAGIATLGVGIAGSVGLPAGADADPALLVLPGLTLVAVFAGLGLGRGSGAQAARGPLLVMAAGLPLAVWGVLASGSLLRPIVPNALPVVVVRGVTVLAIAVGLAALAALGQHLVRATRLDPAALPEA